MKNHDVIIEEETFQEVLSKRYNPQTRHLDLNRFGQDPREIIF